MLIRDRIAVHHAALTPQLRVAADYIADHPAEVATRSLRRIAERINTSPATLTRLARALNFNNYEELKDVCRTNLKHQAQPIFERADILRRHHNTEYMNPLLLKHTSAVINNIKAMVNNIDTSVLQNIADQISKADRVFLIGALGSAPFTRLWGYIAHMAFNHWYVVNDNEGEMASTLHSLDKQDFAIIITQSPHARWSVLAAREIQQTDCPVLVLTDSVACPVIQYAKHWIIVPDDSPQFYSSYVAMLTLIETIMGMVISRSDVETPKQIEAIVENKFRLGQYWQD